MTDFALEILSPLRELNREAIGPFVTREGKSLHPLTVSKVVQEVWEALAAEDTEAGIDNVIEKFTFQDLRRTCETQLASIGVTLELRSHILSHGRSGVQSKHYDRYSYLTEKRSALVKWARHLQGVIAEPDSQESASTAPTTPEVG